MRRIHVLAIASLALACEDPVTQPAEEEDPREVLEACELPTPCMPIPACPVDGPDEAAIRCVLAALSGTAPVHVTVSTAWACGDLGDVGGPVIDTVDFFRWADGTTTCLSDFGFVYDCDPVTRAECQDVAADAPLPENCLDPQFWGTENRRETEAVCR